jgi:hypothetical protein
MYRRLREWFLERFGERDIQYIYRGHGDWDEICGWNFRGRFYERD